MPRTPRRTKVVTLLLEVLGVAVALAAVATWHWQVATGLAGLALVLGALALEGGQLL